MPGFALGTIGAMPTKAPPPLTGQDSRDVLTRFGFADTEIEALVSNSVVHGRSRLTHPFLKIEREDTVAVLTMDEPATRNALSRAEQCVEFIDAISSGIALRYTKRLLRLQNDVI